MNWIALYTNPHWRQLWESKEIKGLEASLRHMLVHARLDDEARGVVRGQLLFLEHVQSVVKVGAEQQQKSVAAKDSTAREQASDSTSRVSMLPPVY